jgi:hypothetical protein
MIIIIMMIIIIIIIIINNRYVALYAGDAETTPNVYNTVFEDADMPEELPLHMAPWYNSCNTSVPPL